MRRVGRRAGGRGDVAAVDDPPVVGDPQDGEPPALDLGRAVHARRAAAARRGRPRARGRTTRRAGEAGHRAQDTAPVPGASARRPRRGSAAESAVGDASAGSPRAASTSSGSISHRRRPALGLEHPGIGLERGEPRLELEAEHLAADLRVRPGEGRHLRLRGRRDLVVVAHEQRPERPLDPAGRRGDPGEGRDRSRSRRGPPHLVVPDEVGAAARALGRVGGREGRGAPGAGGGQPGVVGHVRMLQAATLRFTCQQAPVVPSRAGPPTRPRRARAPTPTRSWRAACC